MAEKNPYEHLLDQITDLLELVNKNKGKGEGGGELPENIEAELDVLEQHVALFKQSTEEALAMTGEDIDSLGSRVSKPQDLPRKQKRFIERASRIRKDLVRAEKGNAAYRTVAKMQKKKSGGKARKKKFKRLSGGDKGWMPL